MPATKTSIYLSDEMRKKLHVPPYGERGASESVSKIVDRYTSLMFTERKKVRDIFTQEEMNVMYNAGNGTVWEPADAIRNGVLADIQDSTDSEIISFGADRKTLENKLLQLTTAQQFALVEEIELFWENVSQEKDRKGACSER
jgi:hypothetical protein